MSDTSDSTKSSITPNASVESLLPSDTSPTASNITFESLSVHNMMPLPRTILTKQQINKLQSKAASDIRRILSNIILLLFRHHPHGIFECELPTFYNDMFGENIFVNTDLKYILSTHRSINITPIKSRGVLYTFNINQLDEIKSLTPILLQTYLIEHILRVFKYFPSGIAVNIFHQTFQNIVGFKLSKLIPQWSQFILSIPYIICFKVQGVDVFMNTFDIYRLKQFHSNQILIQPAGYPQLFYKTGGNIDDKQQFEKAFLLKYRSRLCCDSPYISNILSQMYPNTTVGVQKDERNKSSDDNNNKSPFLEDHCSVFMGGFGHGTTIKNIENELDLMGFRVIDCTELKYRKFGFSWVTLDNNIEADRLISMSPIKIMGNNIDIRPYINRDKQKENNKPNDNIILKEMIKLLLSKTEYFKLGLSIRDIQPILFKKFEYRISGSDLTEIVKSNPKNLCINIDQNGTEKIFVSNKCHYKR